MNEEVFGMEKERIEKEVGIVHRLLKEILKKCEAEVAQVELGKKLNESLDKIMEMRRMSKN